ncbi:hypothetical protein V2J09_012430 [Rumex salicifolius]
MADPVVSELVSSFVEGILGKLCLAAFKEISKMSGVKDELKRLDNTLSAINGSSSNPQISLKNWLHNLKDVAYDIEDVLDLISFHDLELQMTGGTTTSKNTAQALPFFMVIVRERPTLLLKTH